MKIVLLEYDRCERRLVRMEDFDEDRERASAARLEAELAAHATRALFDREIVLLESDSLETLRRTHASYFERPDEIAMDVLTALPRKFGDPAAEA